MKVGYHSCLELSIVAHIFKKLHHGYDLLLLYREIEVLSKLGTNLMIYAFEFTSEDCIGPNLGLLVSHVLVQRGSQIELELLY